MVTVLATDDDATGNNYGVVAYALSEFIYCYHTVMLSSLERYILCVFMALSSLRPKIYLARTAGDKQNRVHLNTKK